jgi:malonyl CoA-acyl carrier protein transacylase
MGAGLLDRFPDWTAEADGILGYSIRRLCLEDPLGQLGQTAFTQPALYVVNALTWRARQEEGRPDPAFVAGHSLGEYNALLAAGVFDFGTGLQLVKRRGELMGRVTGGGMAAVIGLTPERIQEVLTQSEAGRQIDVANFNSFEQTVIAGPQDALIAVKPDFQAAGVKIFTTLNVSAPFHSRYMVHAMEEFQDVLQAVTFNVPRIPVMSNVTATPYPLDDVGGTLGRQIGSAVRWLASVLYLLDQGTTDFEEVGPGNVLTKLVERIKKGVKHAST